MDPRTLEASFHEFARQAGIALDSSPPSVGIQAMLGFYQDRRVDGCDPTGDGDMLLFQWGTYDWGEGERFELDLTRQVILPDEEDDDAIWQLHLTYRFPTSPKLASLESGNRWCHVSRRDPGVRGMGQGHAGLHCDLQSACSIGSGAV